MQSGVGRTGRWWGHQQLTDAAPDMLLFAKGIASGVPFAGVSARPELYSKMSPGMMVRGRRRRRRLRERTAAYCRCALLMRCDAAALRCLVLTCCRLPSCPPRSQGGTYGGSAIGCAAAAATIDVIEGEGLLQNAAERGQQLTAGLLHLAEVRVRSWDVLLSLRRMIPSLPRPLSAPSRVSFCCPLICPSSPPFPPL